MHARKVTLLAFIASLSGAFASGATAHDLPSRIGVTLPFRNEQVARVLVTWLPNYFDVAAFGGPGRVVDIGGRSCLKGTQFILDVDDRFAYDIDETVRLSVEFALDDAKYARAVAVVYDTSGGDGIVRSTLPETAPATFYTHTIELPRARFANRGDLATDFLIAAGTVASRSITSTAGRELTICNLTLSRSDASRTASTAKSATGTLALTIKDEAGVETAVRLGIYDSAGRLVLPSVDAVAVRKFDEPMNVFQLSDRSAWPGKDRFFYYASGNYRATLPAGRYTIVATKGLEYAFFSESVDVRAQATSTLAVKLQRAQNLPAKGWYSGDLHVHQLRKDARDNAALITQAQAQDLHIANILQMGNIAITAFDQGGWGKGGRYQDRSTALVSGQEDPRTDLRGHTSHLNLTAPVRVPEHYLLYNEVFERVATQGGVSGYAHAYGSGGGVIEGLALDVPFGLVSFVEILQSGYANTNNWFTFLNLGYQLAPAAGSDYPFLRDYPGDVRNYVHIDGDFSVDAWFKGLAAGRTYVTNGPFIEFTINGKGMGQRLEVRRGDRLVANVRATINTDLDSIARIELIEQGETVAASATTSLAHEATATHGTWFVVKAYGKSSTTFRPLIAVSAPVYVVVDGEKTWKRESVARIVGDLRARLEKLQSNDVRRSEIDALTTEMTWQQQWSTQKPLLNERIDLARKALDALAAQAAAASR